MTYYDQESEVEALFREAADSVPIADRYEGIEEIPIDPETLSIKNEIRRSLMTDLPDEDLDA